MSPAREQDGLAFPPNWRQLGGWSGELLDHQILICVEHATGDVEALVSLLSKEKDRRTAAALVRAYILAEATLTEFVAHAIWQTAGRPMAKRDPTALDLVYVVCQKLGIEFDLGGQVYLEMLLVLRNSILHPTRIRGQARDNLTKDLHLPEHVQLFGHEHFPTLLNLGKTVERFLASIWEQATADARNLPRPPLSFVTPVDEILVEKLNELLAKNLAAKGRANAQPREGA